MGGGTNRGLAALTGGAVCAKIVVETPLVNGQGAPWPRKSDNHASLKARKMVNAFIRTRYAAAVVLCAVAMVVGRCDAVVINEVMASNSQTTRDAQGQYDDWIELHNPGRSAVDVGGMYLTDDRTVPRKWRIPEDEGSGTRIAGRGFLLIWADGDPEDGPLHASFRLNAGGGELYLFALDGSTLLDSVAYEEQIPDISYGRYPDADGEWRMMGQPTPGAPNVKVYEGIVTEVAFSHDRGFYDGPFELTLACETPGATIHYTLDGSVPFSAERNVPAGRLYTGPILVSETMNVRAIATKANWMASRVGTHSYIFLSEVPRQRAYPTGYPTSWKGYAADYGMDPEIVDDPRYRDLMDEALRSLPSMSLVMTKEDLFEAGRGIYANPTSSGQSWERPGSIELIYPDGRKGFQSNCGVRIQGGWFRSPNACSKKSFRLLFKGMYGTTKLRYPLFGDHAAEEFDTITLRGGANDGYTWSGNERYAQFTRDEFARDLHHDMGQAASHGLFVHLYINGLYWGLYNPCERPDGSFSASYYGGDKEDWDVFRHKSFSVSQGGRSALNEMLSLCQEAAGSGEAYQRLEGNGPDGRRHPDYPHLLDVTNYIDYMIVNMWAGNWDWPWNNYWLARKQTADSTGFKFYCWDTEDIMLSSRSPLTWNATSDTRDVGRPHGSLRQNAEYRLRFADRVHRVFFNGGVLTPASLVKRYEEMASEIELAIIPELARWGDQHGRNMDQEDWYAMRDQILEVYLPQRSAIVLGQFRSAGLYPNIDAPVFHVDGAYRHGGQVATGDLLSMQAVAGTIWYTLDGSDPRAPEVAASSGGGGAGVLVAEDATKRVLVPTGPVDENWRVSPSFDDSAWLSGSGGVGYERSTGYEQYIGIDVQDQMYGRQTGCYIRIPFEVSESVLDSLSSLVLKVRYDDGFVAYLNGTVMIRRNIDDEPAWNSVAVAQNSDIDAVNPEPFDVTGDISALHPGANLLAIHALNVGTTSSDFLCSVALSVGQDNSGGGGTVSSKAIEYTEPAVLSESAQLKARALVGSSWSALNEATYSVGPVAESLRISEIMYHPADTNHPDDPNTEYVELTNIGTETINLNLVAFSSGIELVLPSVELAPGQYVLAVKDVSAFAARYGAGLQVVGPYAGSLANAGERLTLRDATGQTIHDFRFDDNWYTVTDGPGFSLTVRDPLTADANALGDKRLWRPSAQMGGSPGYDDSGDITGLGAVVINELMANPESGMPDWIELYNGTDHAIDLGGWFISDDAEVLTRYEIPSGTVITADGYVVFYGDESFGNEDAPGCHEAFGLSRNGETVYVHSGADGVLTGYSDEEKFDASEVGVSLGRYRKSTGAYNFVALSRATPEAANAEPAVGPVVITEIMYNPAGSGDAEYVELTNISDAPVTLYDEARSTPWRFTDDPDNPGIELFLPTEEPVVLAAGESLVLTKDLASFSFAYSAPVGVRVLAWGAGKLANGSEKVQLSKPGDADGEDGRHWIRVDRVVYSDGGHPEDFVAGVDPWPVAADGGGSALGRINATAYGNDPANWRATEPSPGWTDE